MLRTLNLLKAGMTRVLEVVLILAVAALVGSVVWGVMTRASGDIVVKYSGGSVAGIWAWLPTGQAQWTEEVAKFLLIWVSLLGGAVAFGRHSHLGVDYFVGKLDKSASQWSSMVVHGVVLFFAVAVLLVGGIRVASDTLAMEQTTPVLGWKMGHVYLALPISGIFVILYTLESAFETLAAIRNGDSVSDRAVANDVSASNQEGT
ncbi:TRAP transporter small permease [Mariniblastus sp.]|nr:TRAP transporter small permease [Mariniblastus sp.]